MENENSSKLRHPCGDVSLGGFISKEMSPLRREHFSSRGRPPGMFSFSETLTLRKGNFFPGSFLFRGDIIPKEGKFRPRGETSLWEYVSPRCTFQIIRDMNKIRKRLMRH